MRALFVSCFYEYRFGGAELVMRKLRQQLQSRGHQIDILCLGGGPETQPGNIWRMPPLPWLGHHPQWMKRAILFLNNPAFDRWMLRSVRTFPPAQYDLIHCQDVHSVILAQDLASRVHTQSGLTVQDNVPRQCTQATGNRLVTAILQTCVRLRDRSLRPCLRQFDWITAPSNHVARGIAQFLPPPSLRSSPSIARIPAFFRCPPRPHTRRSSGCFSWAD